MSISIKKLKSLPDAPGVYFFLAKNKKILYIGKATSIRSRVKSYFAKDIADVRSPLIAQMVTQAAYIDHKSTDSVLEAIILEADLIKKFRPEFNTKEKDDKSFYCVTISKEEFPIIRLVRKKDITSDQLFYGPYPESLSIKEGLKIIQKIFPFRDEKCKIGKKPCFNYQIGLCPGTCIGKIDRKTYSTTIRNIKLFFEGKKGALIKLLNKEMKQLIETEEFEEAVIKRNQIWALEHIQDVSLLKRESVVDINEHKKSVFRIESYDIAHMGGKDMVGVMTVMEDGELNKSEYRKFIIKNFSKSNDTGALNEMLTRRIKHTEWRSADLIVIDGGQAQLNTAQRLLENTSVVAVVKDENHNAREIIGDKVLVEKYKKEIIQINAETHRYAINFHKRLRNKAFIPKD